MTLKLDLVPPRFVARLTSEPFSGEASAGLAGQVTPGRGAWGRRDADVPRRVAQVEAEGACPVPVKTWEQPGGQSLQDGEQGQACGHPGGPDASAGAPGRASARTWWLGPLEHRRPALRLPACRPCSAAPATALSHRCPSLVPNPQQHEKKRCTLDTKRKIILLKCGQFNFHDVWHILRNNTKAGDGAVGVGRDPHAPLRFRGGVRGRSRKAQLGGRGHS